MELLFQFSYMMVSKKHTKNKKVSLKILNSLYYSHTWLIRMAIDSFAKDSIMLALMTELWNKVIEELFQAI